MIYVKASDTRENFSSVMDMARREPVVIQKSGKNTVVVLSHEDYERVTRNNRMLLKKTIKAIGEKAKERGVNEKELKRLLEDE